MNHLYSFGYGMEKTLEYLQKVKKMNTKKQYNFIQETEEAKRHSEEKFRRAEINKNEILKNREKKIESNRNQYNSQMIFANLLKSVFKI